MLPREPRWRRRDAARPPKVVEQVDPEIKATAGIVITPMPQAKAAKATKRGGVASVAIGKVDQKNADHAVVTSVIPFGDGSTQTDTGRVRRVDGRWYIAR